SVSEIEYVAFSAVYKIFERQYMRFGQIRHMYIVPNAGAVRSRIIRAEYAHMVALSVGHLKDDRYQMAIRVVRLSYISVSVGSAGVEIPERNVSQSMSLGRPFEHFFHRQLCLAIGVCRLGSVILHYGHAFGLAVGRRGG